MTKAPEYGRLKSLDALRGLAVLMVLIAHLPFEVEPSGIAARLLGLGSFGVDLFFVISGFLISGLLFAEMAKTRGLHVGRFWMRRGLKIWPAYFVAYGTALLLQCVLYLRVGDYVSVRQQLLQAVPNMFFVQNYIWIDSRWFASWSLAIEEHFYLVLPLVFLALSSAKRVKVGIPVFCTLIFVAALLLRVRASGSISPDLLYLQTHFRVDGLCLGVLLCYLWTFKKHVFLSLFSHSALIAFFPLALVFPFVFPWGQGVTETIGLTVISLGCGCVVALAVARPAVAQAWPAASRWAVSLLSVVGTYSYTIYLSQAVALPIGRAHRVGMFSGAHAAVFVTLSLVGGAILSHSIERPALRLRERWFPRPVVAVAVSAELPADTERMSSAVGVNRG